MATRKHIWTDEDAAYAAAQWASGILQRDIARVFGLNAPSMISLKVRRFLAKYAVPDWGFTIDEYYGDDRKALVRQAIAVFVAQRNLEHAEREHEQLMLEGRERGFLDARPSPAAGGSPTHATRQRAV